MESVAAPPFGGVEKTRVPLGVRLPGIESEAEPPAGDVLNPGENVAEPDLDKQRVVEPGETIPNGY